MNSDLSFEAYLLILAEKVSNKFTYIESNGYYTNIYEYVYKVDFLRHFLRLGGRIRLNSELLEMWLNSVNNNQLLNSIETTYKIIYDGVSVEDIDTFVEISSYLRIRSWGETLVASIQLLNIFKRKYNLTLLEFMVQVEQYNYTISGKISGLSLTNFEKRISELSNSKISELWWMWKDFNGEYKSYIDWFPRETLDDLLMISNSGKYQPNYESYIETK